MELIKDYDMKFHYHPGKANVIADTLSRKSYVNTLVRGGLPQELVDDLKKLRLEIVPRGFVAAMEVQSTLLGKIREAQKDDKEIAEIKERMSKGKAKGFCEDEHDTLWFEDRVYVPNNAKIRKLILQEAHDSPYSIHPGNTKMYLDLKEHFWWTGMKKDIAEYVAVCDVCQRVKEKHQKPAGLLQPMPIPEWKWDKLGMNFITGFPRTRTRHDSIWLVVDLLDQSVSLYPSENHLYKCKVGQDIYDQDRMSAWSSKDHRIR